MVIDRLTWRIHEDLLCWIAAEYPGLTAEQYEAAFRLLAHPDTSEAASQAVEELLRGCIEAAAREEA